MRGKTTRTPPFAETIVGRENQYMRLLAKLFDGFANSTRLSILLLLTRRKEMTVGELVEAIGAPRPRVSDHLRCLASCGHVRSRREGRRAFYSIADERVLEMLRLGAGILPVDAEPVEAGDVTGDR